jgi:hypothetical protein
VWLTRHAGIVGELNWLSIEPGVCCAEHRHGASGMAPSGCAMLHPLRVLRLAHIPLTREAAA